MANKIKISMVKYDANGNPLSVAYGDYKPQDVAMFVRGGYVSVEEGLVKQIESILLKQTPEERSKRMEQL